MNQEIVFNKEQKKAFTTLCSGKNVFLTGQAGTGKSFVIQQYIKYCEENNKNVIITAPTGIAALNIGGATMHSTFGIPIPAYGHYEFDIQLSKIKPVTIADVIIIDEISMCRNDVFEYFAIVLKKIKKDIGRNPQVIVVGDFYQLPPIVTKDELSKFKRLALHESGYCFTSPYWKEMKFKCIELKEVVRQSNKEFIDNLNKLRKGDTSCLSYFNTRLCDKLPKDVLYICSTNASADIINENCLNTIDTPCYIYQSKREKICAKEYITDDNLILKKNSKVMFVTNDVINNKYQNGTIGEIEECCTNYVKIRLSNGEVIPVYKYEWKTNKISIVNGMTNKTQIGSYSQLPLKLAYAITMHKTQGQTYDKAIIIPNSFADGQLYVAISRVKSIEGLYLESPILEEYIKVNKIVNDFYENFDYEISDKIIQKKKDLEKKAIEKHNEMKKKKSKRKTKSTSKKTTTKKSTTSSSKKTTFKSNKTNKKNTIKKPITKKTTSSKKSSTRKPTKSKQ